MKSECQYGYIAGGIICFITIFFCQIIALLSMFFFSYSYLFLLFGMLSNTWLCSKVLIYYIKKAIK